MSKEIEKLDTLLQGSKNGEYFIPDTVLMGMDAIDMGTASRRIQEIVKANPRYDFFIDKEIRKAGIQIKWELRVD